MPGAKLTMLINVSTGVGGTSPVGKTRTGGFTESWYLDHWPLTTADYTAFDSLCSRRSALLPTGGIIVGRRYQRVDPVGPSTTDSREFPAASGLLSDMPQMAMYCRGRTAAALNIRPIYIRAIPDARIFRGEYLPSLDYDASLTAYFNQARNFCMRGLDFTLAEHLIKAIAADGTGTFVVAGASPAVGDMVTIRYAKNSADRLRGGAYRFTATNLVAGTFAIAGWEHGACTGGTLQERAYNLPFITSVDISRIVVKKVGRPFDLFSGRQSNRS